MGHLEETMNLVQLGKEVDSQISSSLQPYVGEAAELIITLIELWGDIVACGAS